MTAIDRTSPFTGHFDSPDETQSFPLGSSATVRLGSLVVGRIVCEPGWRWEDQVKPTAGTPTCQFHHVGVGLNGELRFRMDDGVEFSVQAGDVFDIPPGHDVWVVGEEPSVTIMWSGWRGFGKRPIADRVVTTLVFTDIVDSTKRASNIGDYAWDRLLDSHHDAVRAVIDEYHGTEITTTGDGFLATFPGVAVALAATRAISNALGELELEIRAAVHTGEVDLVQGDVRGLAVHEAARILALARPGEILVSSTTRELARQPDSVFVDRGLQSLPGITGKRQIYSYVASGAV